MRMLVIGGDRRSGWLVRRARDAGWEAEGVWLDRFDPSFICAWPDDARFDVYVLPYPVAEREGAVVTPLASRPLEMAEARAQIPSGARVMAGKGDINGAWTVFSPAALESFAVGNAATSAEGAIFEAMRQSEGCIAASNCLIVGYGRIGRLLARKLLALGARVTVAARKEKDRVWATAEGCGACTVSQIAERVAEMHFVFNTAPAPVIGEAELKAMRADALVLELASAPYGIDLPAAKRLGRQALLAAGIPGKYAPASAAEALLRAIEACIAPAHAER